MKPHIKSGYRSTYHRDRTVSYWSVYSQSWQRTTAYNLTNRHDDYFALPPHERKRISNMAFS